MLNEKYFTKEASAERIEFVSQLKKTAYVHLIGICGTGMSAVAGLLKTLGFRVTGSDKAFYPPMGDVVKGISDRLFTGYDPQNLKEKPDLVVIGNSVSADNLEVKEVLKQGLPFASMPEIFSALLIGSHKECGKSVVISGTHGKTTTTAAIACMLDFSGYAPGYFIGGVPLDLSSGIRLVDFNRPPLERVVVLEGDEYDSAFFAKRAKFHSYRPDIAVLTSLEFDHADIYSSIEEIEQEFTEFVKLVPSDGQILVCDQAPRLVELVKQWKNNKEVKAQISFYGLSPKSSYNLQKRDSIESGQQLKLSLDGEIVECSVNLSGEYNALNFTAVAAVGKILGLSLPQISESLANFHGVKRRQQIVADKQGVLVIEDFAHHPTAVDVTLRGLKEKHPNRRLIAVFEPRSNTSRQGFFQKEYGESFNAADLVVLLNIQTAVGYSKSKQPILPLDVKQVAQDIVKNNPLAQAHVFENVGQICEFVVREGTVGDLVVVMSNGDFGGVLKMIVDRLK